MRTSTGITELDQVLAGGYESSVITTLYGPPGSGKTNLCMLAVRELVKKKKKVIYIDTENSFSAERYAQIDPEYQEHMDRIIFFRPTIFEEQKKVFQKIVQQISSDIGMVIVDSIAMLYRLELGNSADTYNTNRELGVQLAVLADCATRHQIPILITSQVYSKMDETDAVNIVGGDITRYSSKCLIELQKYHDSRRLLILRKHRSIKEGKKLSFEIVNEGISILRVSE